MSPDLTNASEQLMDEKQLLRDCLDGNRHAQKRLYELFARRMFGVCLRYAPDQQSAEDFLQEGFIRVFVKLDSFRSQGSLEGWIRRIMVNTSLELLRRKDVLKYSVDIGTQPDLPGEEDDLPEEISGEVLLMHMQQMPAGFRTVFNLYAVEELPHKEIASMLGISEGTSKSQYARARAWLQKRLTENQ
jgi:RNA polymerase sigma-70 factor (ECF subfamily)